MKNRIPQIVTALAVVIAILAGWALLNHYERNPWTRDAQVRANVVGIAPRVAGPVINIPVRDNQPVKAGDLLFEIDPATYRAAVDSAEAALQVAQAQALQQRQNLGRQQTLFEGKVIDQQAFQNAQDATAAADAAVAQSAAALETAQLNLSYTKAFAPVNGYLTNVNVSPGTYVSAGQQLLALVDSSSFYIYAYFTENVISAISPEMRAQATLMGHEGSPINAVVRSVGWAIHLEDGGSVNLLPNVSPNVSWIRLAQRFPVRVELTEPSPIPLRIGQTASVAVFAKPKESKSR